MVVVVEEDEDEDKDEDKKVVFAEVVKNDNDYGHVGECFGLMQCVV